MSNLVGVWALIATPRGASRRWRKSEVRASAWSDWTGLLEDASQIEAGTATALIDRARHRAIEPFFVEVKVTANAVVARAVLSLDDDLDACAALCIALRATERFGGTGDVLVASLSDDTVNAHVALAKKGSSCRPAKRGLLAAPMRELQERAVDTVSAGLAARADTIRKEGRALAARSDLESLRARVLALLSKQPDKVVLAKAKLLCRSRELSQDVLRMKTGTAVLDFLRGGGTADALPVSVYGQPLALLAALDMTVAEPLALELAALEAPYGFKSAAFSALARSKSSAARSTLLRALVTARDEDRGNHVRYIGDHLVSLPSEIAEHAVPLLEAAERDVDTDTTAFEYLRALSAALCAHRDPRGHRAVALLYSAMTIVEAQTWIGRCLLFGGSAPKSNWRAKSVLPGFARKLSAIVAKLA
jgi:hypothetical protein